MKEDLKNMPEAYWRKKLAPEQLQIVRNKGTESPFSGIYNDHSKKGMYRCVGCGAELFSSDNKFHSGCGWPSFYESFNKENLDLKDDFSFGMKRVEVSCKKCGAHLGHLFDDGPSPTRKRYCINSLSLDFKNK